MNSYQSEQLDALKQVTQGLVRMGPAGRTRLLELMRSYMDFRSDLEGFLKEHLGPLCTSACFERRTSACCSKDGIITFWADVVINACCSTETEIRTMAAAIENPLRNHKCIYLGESGCVWRVRPLVCAMFVCDRVQADVIDRDPALQKDWEDLRHRAKGFRWPDRPVLFDRLEEIFLNMGCRSTLMYLNTSPGLMRIKQKAGQAASPDRPINAL